MMVVNPAEGAAGQLARRLRSLRKGGLVDETLTQGELAKALRVSVSLISSWESQTDPTIPPRDRLADYATFFATERSVARAPYRVLPISDLTSDERTSRDELFKELTSLRNAALGRGSGSTVVDPFAGSHWRFPRGEDITIVCSALPPAYLEKMPYTNPGAPDYIDMYRYADPDALLALFGHLRAANPVSEVRVRVPAEVKDDDYTGHLVLLGGIDWNKTTADLLHLLGVPVRQLPRENDDDPGGFLVSTGEGERRFEPVLRKVDGRDVLIEDVVHFLRAPSPLNERRTVTICNGNYARGTLAAVRALTDARFRDRNENYLHRRFAGRKTFSILSRVKMILGAAATPDWTSSEDLLHEWPVPQCE